MATVMGCKGAGRKCSQWSIGSGAYQEYKRCGVRIPPEAIFQAKWMFQENLFLYKTYASQKCIPEADASLYTNGCSGGLQGSRPLVWSLHIALGLQGVLGGSGFIGLVVKILTQNVRNIGLNPTWSHFSQQSGCFKKIYFFIRYIHLRTI